MPVSGHHLVTVPASRQWLLTIRNVSLSFIRFLAVVAAVVARYVCALVADVDSGSMGVCLGVG